MYLEPTAINFERAIVVSRKGNLEYIDALRGIAIFGVLCVHFTLFGKESIGFDYLPFHLDMLLYEGRYGVALFFVVSAFTLARSLESRNKTESVPIRRYFLRRFFRIAPAFYLVILLLFFIKGVGYPGYVDPSEPELTWTDLFAHMTFINAFSPYYINDFIGVEWSVATEFSFYMLLPLLMYPLLLHTNFFTKCAIIIALYLVAIYLYWLIFVDGLLFQLHDGLDAAIGNIWSYFFIGSHLHVFIVGILVWLFLTQYHVHEYLAKKTAVIILLGLLIIAIFFAYFQAENLNSVTISFLALIFWGAMSGSLIIVFDVIRPRLKWLEFLGKVSFSLYLVHFLVVSYTVRWSNVWGKIEQLSTPEVTFLIFFLLNSLLSVGIAMLMYKYIEQPGMNYGRAFIKRRYG